MPTFTTKSGQTVSFTPKPKKRTPSSKLSRWQLFLRRANQKKLLRAVFTNASGKKNVYVRDSVSDLFRRE